MTNLVDKLRGKIREQRRRVVVIGDTMIDRWVRGYVEPCQDGCPKFVQGEVVEVPGGAGNAARCLDHWGINVSLCGYTADECPVKTRYVTDNGKIWFRADDERVARRAGYDWARELALEWCLRASAVLLSDYDKGFLTPELIRRVVKMCQTRGIPCVADCKRPPGVYEGCILKGNHLYSEKYTVECEVITNGEGLPFIHGKFPFDLSPEQLPTVKCVNHVGAGDCFAAHLALALAYGFSLKEAAVLAHSAGRVYVQHPHNRPPLPAEIAADLASAGTPLSPASQTAPTP